MECNGALSRRGFLALSSLALLGGCAGRLAQNGSQRPLVSFGLVTDLHAADLEPNGERHYRDSAAKLAACIEDLNRRNVDFLIELGDFKDQGKTAEETLRNLAGIESVFTTFKGPRYHVLGNHDMDRITKAQALAGMANTGIASGRSYYSFDRGGVHFVVLDATFRADGTSYDAGNFKWTEALVPEAELAWLADDLSRTRRPTIVFIHQLLDGDADVYFVRNAAAVRRVLEQSGRVRAVFQGHYHEGRYSRLNGISYYTLKAMVVGAAPANAYAVAEVMPDGSIRVAGAGSAESRLLTAE